MINFLGFISGFLFMLIIAAMDNKTAKEECEQNLPRAQKCVLIAVPEISNETLNNNSTDSDSANR